MAQPVIHTAPCPGCGRVNYINYHFTRGGIPCLLFFPPGGSEKMNAIHFTNFTFTSSNNTLAPNCKRTPVH